MVKPLSRVGAGNREDSRSQRGQGRGCRCRGLSACTGLQVVSAMGAAFLSLHPKQSLLPVLIKRVQVLIVYTIMFGFHHRNTGSCLNLVYLKVYSTSAPRT